MQSSRGSPSFSLCISKISHCQIILIPRRPVPPIKQHPRLLLRISGQDNDSERRRRRGVSADRRKDLTMTNIAGFSPFVYLYHPCIYDTLDSVVGHSWQFSWINVYHVAWRNYSRQFITPLERGIVRETCLSRSIFSIGFWTIQYSLIVLYYIYCQLTSINIDFY